MTAARWTARWRPSELDVVIERSEDADAHPLIVVRPRLRAGEAGREQAMEFAERLAEGLSAVERMRRENVS